MKPARLSLVLLLACFLFAFSTVALQQSPLLGWQQTQQSDAVHGTYTQFSLAGKFIKTPPGDTSSRPSLVVDCSANNRSHKSKFVRGTLIVGDPLKIDWVEPEEIHGISYFPKVAVLYRVNDAKEEKEEWSAGTDKSSASFSKRSFQKMLRAHTFEITAEDKGGSQILMLFDMPDSTLVEQGCDLDDHKK